jgi:hypothetical protein
MKSLAHCLCSFPVLLLVGCASLRPADQPPFAADALWFPTGYESFFRPGAIASPPGSLAEFRITTGQTGEKALRSFAAQFPGAEADIISYHRVWAAFFAREAWPLLQENAASPLALETLAGRMSSEATSDLARESLGFLHRALANAADSDTRVRLQNLLIVHEIQQLRAQAILESNQRGCGPCCERLVRTLQEKPAPASFEQWLKALDLAERQSGDLAGRDGHLLAEGQKDATGITVAETLVMNDPADRGLARYWQRQWPKDAMGNRLGVPFPRWKSTCQAGDTRVVWFMTRLVSQSDPPTSVSVNLRGVRGTVRAYMDGFPLGEHDEREKGRVSCRLPREISPRGSATHYLILRIERPAGLVGSPALWHQPWLTVD